MYRKLDIQMMYYIVSQKIHCSNSRDTQYVKFRMGEAPSKMLPTLAAKMFFTCAFNHCLYFESCHMNESCLKHRCSYKVIYDEMIKFQNSIFKYLHSRFFQCFWSRFFLHFDVFIMMCHWSTDTQVADKLQESVKMISKLDGACKYTTAFIIIIKWNSSSLKRKMCHVYNGLGKGRQGKLALEWMHWNITRTLRYDTYFNDENRKALLIWNVGQNINESSGLYIKLSQKSHQNHSQPYQFHTCVTNVPT